MNRPILNLGKVAAETRGTTPNRPFERTLNGECVEDATVPIEGTYLNGCPPL